MPHTPECWRQRLVQAAQARTQATAQRRRFTIQARAGVKVRVDGVELIDFAGNDYLGLAGGDALVEAWAGSAAHGVGAGASHLVSGHHAAHARLERSLAEWLGAPRALLLGSGYAANLAVLQALLGDGDVCVQDRLNHASLIDGARLAGCELRRYPHADVAGAGRQLERGANGHVADVTQDDVTQADVTPDHDSARRHGRPHATACAAGGPPLPRVRRGGASASLRDVHVKGLALLATDGVFSMDGDIAPLRELAALAAAHQALCYVDEAHALGVLGPHGAGSVAAAGLDHHAVPLRLCTLGKALGGYGAALVGDGDLIEHLLQNARPYIYTTALPPALAATLGTAVERARDGEALRERLRSRIAQFRAGAAERALPVLPSPTPIQPILLGDNSRTMAAAEALRQRGFWVGAIRPPTVPAGQARLRVTLSAAHAAEQVEALLDALGAVCDAH